ncbi:hypothetical protein D3C85_1723880 [compost metagenome]
MSVSFIFTDLIVIRSGKIISLVVFWFSISLKVFVREVFNVPLGAYRELTPQQESVFVRLNFFDNLLIP